jgi:hypothetical protein
MMKKVLLSLLIVITMSTTIFAQGFTFSASTGTYADLTGTTSLNQSLTWDDPEYTVTLPFSFPFWGKPVNTIYVGDGYIALNQDWDTIIAVYFTDLIDRGSISGTSVSPISYKVESVGGTQVFKLEWQNFGFYDEMDMFSTLDWYANAQLWLYENGIWEVRLGANSIAQPTVAFWGENGPAVGYGDETNNYWLSGMAANPALVKNTLPMFFPFLSSVPANGTIYTFTPIGIGIQGIADKIKFAAWPNPVVSELHIDLPEPGTVEIADMTGKRLLTMNAVEAGQQLVDLSNFSNGIYLVVLTTQSGEKATRKIVKQ